MKRRYFVGLFLAGLVVCPVVWGWGGKKSDPPTIQVPANPQALESQFVRFQPNVPLLPGSLNLYGYERERIVRSYPILSPDRSQMVLSEVIFMPENAQTFSRVYLYTVGEAPQLIDIVPPERLEAIEEEQRKHLENDPLYVPQVPLAEVKAQAFWQRYQPEKQAASRRTLLETGVSTVQDYRTDILHVADWSADGKQLLIIYRSGIHHLGLRKTIPIVFNLTSYEAQRLTYLPQLIWDDMYKRSAELKSGPHRVWDIRPLGWAQDSDEDLVVKLVVFEGQSEVPIGFWRYGTNTGRLQHLGTSIRPDLIAQHGWTLQFRDPTATEGPQIYGPGETPPSQKASIQTPTKRPWRNRVQFWKKQR